MLYKVHVFFSYEVDAESKEEIVAAIWDSLSHSELQRTLKGDWETIRKACLVWQLYIKVCRRQISVKIMASIEFAISGSFTRLRQVLTAEVLFLKASRRK